MSSRRPDDDTLDTSYNNISRRRLLAAGGAVAAGSLAGCLDRVASSVTRTNASPAAVFAGEDESVGDPHVSRLDPSVSASSGPLSGDVELEAWVTAVTLEDYNTPRSNRSAANPDDLDSDDDGVDDEVDVRETALGLERTLFSRTNEAAESISKRSARTGPNPETNDPITEHFEEIMGTIDEIQATLESCSDDVCVTVRKNADHREVLVQQAQGHVENGEWDDAAAAVDEVRDIVEGDIERLEDYNSPRSNRSIAAPDGVRTDDEADEIIRYLDDAPVVSERFTVCLPDAELPGGNGSLVEEVTPQRFIDYITGRAASDDEGELYSWGGRPKAVTVDDGDEEDDMECSEIASSSSRNEVVCMSNHLEADVSGPSDTGGGLRSTRTDIEVTVMNDPPRAEAGASVLICPVDGEAYEPSDLSEWGSESGGSSETPTVVCQVWTQPPECPYPVPALLYVKRCRSDEQLVYTGGWVLDTAGLYEESVTMLTVVGETQVVGIKCCLDFSVDTDSDGYGDLVSRSVSGERNQRGARVESGTVSALVEAGTLSEEGGGEVYCWGDNDRSEADPGSCGETGGAGGGVVVTHCPLDAPVLHLMNAGSASDEVKFKAGAELSKSVN